MDIFPEGHLSVSKGHQAAPEEESGQERTPSWDTALEEARRKPSASAATRSWDQREGPQDVAGGE